MKRSFGEDVEVDRHQRISLRTTPRLVAGGLADSVRSHPLENERMVELWQAYFKNSGRAASPGSRQRLQGTEVIHAASDDDARAVEDLFAFGQDVRAEDHGPSAATLLGDDLPNHLPSGQ